MKFNIASLLCLLFVTGSIAEVRAKSYEVKSPDGNITVKIENGEKLLWSVNHKGQQIIEPSAISLNLVNDEILGDHAVIRNSKTSEVDTEFKAINYRKSVVKDRYNELILHCKNDYGVIFRAYNDAVAYRFFTEKKGEILVYNEEANFNFSDDYKIFAPYLWDYRNGQKFNASFESLYTRQRISEFYKDSLIFLPFLVDLGNGKKVEIVEADLENYPGMYLVMNETHQGYKGLYAPYPLEAEQYQRNYIPTKRAAYIARVDGSREFPWRAIVISEQDKELLDNDIVQKLASPSRIGDASWIKPG
ncbi:MAG: glycoside hydrolase family 97 N-terminal domain-containing protein [Bacteroidales bacterium]